jgi:hypothetical protein
LSGMRRTIKKKVLMQTIVLFGNSLVISTLGASIEGQPGLRLLRVDANRPGPDRLLGDLQPDIVIFDLSIQNTDFALSLWKDLPDLLLVGVTPGSSELLVLSGRRQQVLSVEDLLALMREEGKNTKDEPLENCEGARFGKNEWKNNTTKTTN